MAALPKPKTKPKAASPRTAKKSPLPLVSDPDDFTKLVTLDVHIARRPGYVDPAAYRTTDPHGYIAWAKAEFCRALGNMGSVLSACVACGATREEVVCWRAEDKSFASAWDCALEDSADRLENAAIRRAVHGVEEPVYFANKIIGYRTVYSDQLLKMLLEGAKSAKYRRNVTIEGGATSLGVRVTDTRRESIANKILAAIAVAVVPADE